MNAAYYLLLFTGRGSATVVGGVTLAVPAVIGSASNYPIVKGSPLYSQVVGNLNHQPPVNFEVSAAYESVVGVANTYPIVIAKG